MMSVIKYLRSRGCLLTVVFLVSACHKEIYDPESPRKNFFIPEVPADFDWSSLASVALKVTPYDCFNGKYYYTLEVFETNPLEDPEAILLMKGVCKGQAWETTLSLPEVLTQVYIRQTTPTGRKSIATASITQGKAECSFVPGSSPQPSSRVATFPVEGDDYILDESSYEIPELPAHTETFVPGNMPLKTGKDYLLQGNYSGNILFSWPQSGERTRLFITGNWKSKGHSEIPENTQIIVCDGGKIESNGSHTLSFRDKAALYIAANGQAGVQENTGIEIEFSNSGNLVNKGKLYIRKAQTGSSPITCYNSGEMKVKEDIELNNPGEFINRGMFICKNFKTREEKINILNSGTMQVLDQLDTHNPGIFKNEKILIAKKVDLLYTTLINSDSICFEELECNQGSIHNLHKLIVKEELELKQARCYNECRIEAGNVKLEGSELHLATQTSVSCKKLDVKGSNIYIGHQALLEATKKTEFSNWTSQVHGNGSDFGLFRTDTIQWEKNGGLHVMCYGNLQIDCQRIAKNNPYNPAYLIYAPAHFAEGGATVTIPAGICTSGGHQTDEGKPEDPQFPVVSTLQKKFSWVTEDTYPSPGDYDLNDLVVGIDSISYLIDKNNEVQEMTLYMQLKAVGALLRLGAAIQLDDILPQQVEKVSRSHTIKLTDGIFETDGHGTEKGTDYAVIPLFDNAHDVLGLPDHRTITNTISSGKTGHLVKPAQPFHTSIRFTQPVTMEKLNISRLNFFVIAENRLGMRNLEIHLSGFSHTNKSSVSEEIRENTQNLMWSLLIPGEFRYAEEKTDIRTAYPDFQEWVTSNKEQHKNWYENYIGAHTYHN